MENNTLAYFHMQVLKVSLKLFDLKYVLNSTFQALSFCKAQETHQNEFVQSGYNSHYIYVNIQNKKYVYIYIYTSLVFQIPYE